MRKIYAIEVFEREGDGIKVIHTTVLPDIPVTRELPLTIEDLKVINNAREAIPSYKLAIDNMMDFTIDYWYPTNFYNIVLVDWKYD